MSDSLVLRAEDLGLTEGLARIKSLLMGDIGGMTDVQALLLGEGLSGHTLRSYTKSIEAFLDHSGRLHPLQVRVRDIEGWYDTMRSAGAARKTCVLRIAGLRAWYRALRREYGSIVTDPFADMPKKLNRKLSKAPKGEKAKALNAGEIERLMSWLAQDDTLMGQSTHALASFLLCSGLRASEACALKWGDIEDDEGTWYATGIGKGAKPYRQELIGGEAVIERLRRVFRRQHSRAPRASDALLWTTPKRPEGEIHPMPYQAAYLRIRVIGERVPSNVTRRKIGWSPHMLRHTVISYLANDRGMPLPSVRVFARHESVATTQHYVHNARPAHEFAGDLVRMVA